MQFFMGKNRGAISVFLALILLPMLIFSGIVVDVSRLYAAKTVVSGAGDLTMNAALSRYDKKLKDEYHMSIIIITHNFGVIAELCDRVSVMYAGKIAETGDVSAIFHQPKHPYTKDLIDSIPRDEATGEKLVTIPGFPPRLDREIVGCPYAPRCCRALPECQTKAPELTDFGNGHMCSCHLYDKGGVENV